jgi:hypothetical protein
MDLHNGFMHVVCSSSQDQRENCKTRELDQYWFPPKLRPKTRIENQIVGVLKNVYIYIFK